jgi:hypothetical protein
MRTALLVLLLISGLITPQAIARTLRNPAQRAAFIRNHPCPVTGRNRGACPGYIVDHIEPLCAGGLDNPGNMQWQTVMEAKEKDRKEREMCRH